MFQRLVGSADAVLDNLRGDLPAKLGLDLRGAEGGQPAHRLRAPFRLRPRGLAPRVARLRLPDAGRGRPHDAHRRARRPADALRPVDRRPDDRPRGGVRPARRRHQARARPASAWTSTRRSSTSRCTTSTTPAPGTSTAARSPAARARSGHPSLVPSQLYRTQDGWIFIMCNKEKFWPLLARGARPSRVDRRSRARQLRGSASRTASASRASSTTR